MSRRVLGFIGGSGLYGVKGLENVRETKVDTPLQTPWGPPSGPVIAGTFGDVETRFIARHGEGHTLPPSAVNYRANIDAMKRAGVTDLVSISACGSFREELAPGVFVIVDQFIDRTSGRENSFFGPGCVAHVSMAHPVCPTLAGAAADAADALSIPNARSGTYLCIDGPQFSSLAESHLYRAWGCDVIGMTNATEAKLAREAELPYASVAMVTDYDCWHESEGPVEVGTILDVMRQNTEKAGKLIAELARRLGPTRASCPAGIETCLDRAIITPAEARDPALVKKLDAVAGRVLNRR